MEKTPSLKQIEQKSKEMAEGLKKAYEEIGPQCETFGNYLRNTLAGLRAGTSSVEDVRKLLKNEVDVTIYSIQHLDDEEIENSK